MPVRTARAEEHGRRHDRHVVRDGGRALFVTATTSVYSLPTTVNGAPARCSVRRDLSSPGGCARLRTGRSLETTTMSAVGWFRGSLRSHLNQRVPGVEGRL